MAAIFTLEALPAHKGDSLILHFGTAAAPKLAVIDGGPSKVYKPALRPRLFDIRAARNIPAADPLEIDLLMISHIDDDHIKGILEFAKELKDSKAGGQPAFAKIAALWHNSFDDIIGNAEIPAAMAAFTASVGGGDFPAGTNEDAAFILASVMQGRTLRNYANALNWETNKPFNPLVMMTRADDPDVTRFGGGLSLQILGPQRAELVALQKAYDKELHDKGISRDSPEAALASTQDDSVPNLSSIVTLAEVDGKTMLLTGDALGANITDALHKRGLASLAAPLKVDLLKLPHHGSDRNVTPAFFKLIKADHYVFCGDGSHGNPERATVEMLFAEQGGQPVTLHFTSTIKKIDAKRKSVREKDGMPWTAADDSLADLFKQEKAANRAFTFVEAKDRTGVRIDLLNPVAIAMQ